MNQKSSLKVWMYWARENSLLASVCVIWGRKLVTGKIFISEENWQWEKLDQKVQNLKEKFLIEEKTVKIYKTVHFHIKLSLESQFRQLKLRFLIFVTIFDRNSSEEEKLMWWKKFSLPQSEVKKREIYGISLKICLKKWFKHKEW